MKTKQRWRGLVLSFLGLVMSVLGATPTKNTGPAVSALEEDWLYQIAGRDAKAALVGEIAAARQLAERIRKIRPDATVTRELVALDLLAQKSAASDAEHRRLYLDVRRIKRRIMLRHPAVDFTQILLIDQPFPHGREWTHEACHRLGRAATHGGRLLVLDGLDPAARVRQLAPAKDEEAAFWRPDLSFDAKRVLFCMKPKGDRTFHLYEINLDGSNLRQLTGSQEYDDLDPIYLPGGKVMFCTTRCNTYIRCGPYIPSHVLARCDADGRNIYLISRNSESDWLPTLLSDGRVIYSRWEYTDKQISRVQGLWTMNQDGAGVTVFWGNQSVWPDHLAQARSIPGTSKVMFAGVGHHKWFSGSLGVIEPDKGGFNYPIGITRVTWDVPWGEVGNGPQEQPHRTDYKAAGRFVSYQTPFPLSEDLFLVSAQRASQPLAKEEHPYRGWLGPMYRAPFSLYLMDIHGNRELIWRGRHNAWHAMPLRPRSFPQQPDRVAWPGTGREHKPPQTGILYSPNVYEGVPELQRGSVTHLRVIEQIHKTYSTVEKVWGVQGPAISAVAADSVKRVLGTVPVAADGSVCFEAPAGKALFFQLLNKHGMAVQTMRSFTGVMPGEVRGCVGCHERQANAPASNYRFSQAPSKITPPSWGDNATIGYERLVQPVLDKHCGKCHQGEGKGRKKLDLTLRKAPGMAGEHFKEPYLTLVGPKKGCPAGGGFAGSELIASIFPEKGGTRNPAMMKTLRPLTHLSPRSRLIEIAMSGKHNKVKVTGADLERLITWVDCNVPYLGEEEIRQMPDRKAPGWTPRPRLATAPHIERFNIPQDDLHRNAEAGDDE